MTKKPRLLLLSTNADRAGAPRHLSELAAGIHGRYELLLVTGARGYLTESMASIGVSVIVIPDLIRAVSPVRDFRAYHALRAVMVGFRPHLVHAHSSKAGVLGRLAAYRLGIPSIFTAHGWPFAPRIPLIQRLYSLPVESLMARLTDAIITVSDYDRRLALRWRVAGNSKLTTIHNGISESPYRADPGTEGVTDLAMVARFSPQKDHETLLRAMLEVDEKVKCTLAGDGPRLERVQAMVAETGLADRVVLPGEVEGVAQLLAASKFFVLASRWEGLPITILEAMRAGLPVVASDVGGVSEVVIDGKTGYLFPPGQPQILADRVNRLADDPRLRDAMGLAGRERYVELFTAESMVKKTGAVYERLFSHQLRMQ